MIYLVFSFKNKETFRNLNVESFLPCLQSYLPAAYKKSRMTIWASPNNKFVSVSWNNFNINCDNKKSYACQPVLQHPLKGSIISSGYAHEGILNSNNANLFPDIFELVDMSDSRFKLKDSPGGIGTYTWVSPDESTSVSWNTQPPVEPLFVGKNNSEFCVVGNRVLLVAMASWLSTSSIKFDRSYLNSYIPTGYALDGTTIHENVKMLSANKSIACKNGNYSYSSYPLEPAELIPQDMLLEDKSSLLASALVKAFDVLKDFDSSTFWLSGGKDSRTLAAVLASLNMKADAISFGNTEYDFARPVADACSVEYTLYKMHVISDPIAAAKKTNMFTEGLGVGAAHQFNFQYPALNPELPILHGQGHLLRGGYARTMTSRNYVINSKLADSFLGKFTTREANSKILRDVKNWEKTRSFIVKQEKLYWANHDFRLGSYIAPTYLDIAGKSCLIHPIVDEKVARIASGLTMFDKVSERVLFGAMRQLCPILCELPLYSEQWRFDRSYDKTDFIDSNHNFQDSYQKRHIIPISTIDKNKSYFIREGDVNHSQSLKVKNEFILDSSIFNTIEALVKPQVISVIKNRARGENTDAQYIASLDANGKFGLEALINRIFIGATLYDSDWILT